MALPTQIDPRKLAAQGMELEGIVVADQLLRLAQAVERIVSPLQAKVAFFIDEGNCKVARGELQVDADVPCQRCLDTVRITVSTVFEVQVVWSEEQMANVSADREAWLVSDRHASLLELLEDEILLALPLVSYHGAGECTGDTLYDNEASPIEEEVVDNPFSVLQQLKK